MAPPGGVALSDPLLFRVEQPDSLPLSLGDAVGLALGSPQLSPGERVGVFWETYGLAAHPQPFRVTLTGRREGASLLQRIATWAGLAHRDDPAVEGGGGRRAEPSWPSAGGVRPGVAGWRAVRAPGGARGSLIAFIPAPGAPAVPASPTPFAPSGLTGVGVTVLCSSKVGKSMARGADRALLPRSTSYWDQGAWNQVPANDTLRWYVFDDRQMYRPGEQGHVKGWLRRVGGKQDGDVGPAGSAVNAVHYQITGPQGTD